MTWTEWRDHWRPVEHLVEEIPRWMLSIEWPSTGKITPNDTVSVGKMMERPKLSWPVEHGALYTVGETVSYLHPTTIATFEESVTPEGVDIWGTFSWLPPRAGLVCKGCQKKGTSTIKT